MAQHHEFDRYEGEAAASRGQDTVPLGETLTALAATITQRREAAPEESYTARLLAANEDALLKKIGEEATEIVMAAKDKDRAHLTYEMADFLYHLLVLCERSGISLDDLSAELQRRRA